MEAMAGCDPGEFDLSCNHSCYCILAILGV